MRKKLHDMQTNELINDLWKQLLTSTSETLVGTEAPPNKQNRTLKRNMTNNKRSDILVQKMFFPSDCKTKMKNININSLGHEFNPPSNR